MQDGGQEIAGMAEVSATDKSSLLPSAPLPIDEKFKLELKKLAIDRAKLKIERDKLNFEIKKFNNEAHHRRATQTNQYATIAIRNVVLINGAAAIATLTYLGNIAKNGSLATATSAVSGSSAFVTGVFTASFCTILAYGARATYKGNGSKPPLSILLEILSWICGLIALFCFPVGAYNLSKAIDSSPIVIYVPPMPRIIEMDKAGHMFDVQQYAPISPGRTSSSRTPGSR